ncbi:MAG TPA: hypothetical protein VLR71_11025 [Casimicrobiaceae bacterium]|nr:hypothetical protein [Casimicrobiaceae bacterium]
MDANLRRRDVLALLAAVGATGALEGAAQAADPRPAAPQAAGSMDASTGKEVFKNDKLRVVQHLSRPRMGVCGTGLHSHPPHLTIALTDAKARVTLPGKEPFIDERKAGDLFWDPGGPHVVENIGSRDTKVYLVEPIG